MATINNLIAPEGLGDASPEDVAEGVTFTSNYGIRQTGTASKGGDGTASYLTFVSGRTGDELDAAFGKNNEDYAMGIGMSLAMYTKYKNPAIDLNVDFPSLCTCASLSSILASKSALFEIFNNADLINLISTSPYANDVFILNANSIAVIKSTRTALESVASNTVLVDSIRTNEITRAEFNKNRIRILATGEVSWTVPDDFPCDFIHVQLIGGGGASCGQYVQGFMSVTAGQTITGSIGLGADTVFGEFTAKAGAGASQSGAWLVKASDGGSQGVQSTSYKYYGGIGGFEGGQGQNGKNNTDHSNPGGNSNNCGKGDGTLGHCEGTGGSGSGYDTATDGGGGGGQSMNFSGDPASVGAAGGGGYGGGGQRIYYKDDYSGCGGGGSGAIVITCPDGYIPEYVVYNTIDGVTAWRRDENIFNDFGENA